ncbi:hypothetical protein AKO1_000783 [Acrasis kona]|uniref:Uncharacterized protein n=1 Tax=Acrasis kona TaxID=1008807 RepID=A0AAW2ZEF8_9EUKA
MSLIIAAVSPIKVDPRCFITLGIPAVFEVEYSMEKVTRSIPLTDWTKIGKCTFQTFCKLTIFHDAYCDAYPDYDTVQSLQLQSLTLYNPTKIEDLCSLGSSTSKKPTVLTHRSRPTLAVLEQMVNFALNCSHQERHLAYCHPTRTRWALLEKTQ